MNRSRCHFCVFAFYFCAFTCAGLLRGQIVDLKIGDANIELAAATPTAFRLSVSYADKVVPAKSIFLSPDLQAPSATVVNENGWTGVKTGAGELLVDPNAAQWKLLDAKGATIIPAGPICELTHNVQTGEPFVQLDVGAETAESFQQYGCGDTTDALIQGNATPHLGNGHAVVPHYWTRSGYAALGVGADDNSPPSWVAPSELGRVTWFFHGKTADLYLMPAPNLDVAARVYAQLSGIPQVPPRWTFGYLQSRWGWKNDQYIRDVLKEFTTRKLPVDAFIFDFEWYATSPDYELGPQGSPDFKDFSFNPDLFPKPAQDIALLHNNGIHFVGIRKPRLGNTDLVNMARAKGWILAQGASGAKIDSRCLDFSNPEVRAWYAQQIVPLLSQGIDGWWDDEGEITYTQYYWWNQAEADALKQVRPNDRLWTIDRAFAPGVQRFGAAAWTGDIGASWTYFDNTPTRLLNWNLGGMPYCGCDIGGFFGDTTPRLLTRWMEAGVFFPVMRAHSVDSTTPHFPWLYGPDAEAAIRKALELRYRLIPYIYSLAHHTHETGVPIMRPLIEEFPDDSRCADISDEWLLGKNILAAPILDESDARRVYLPAQTSWDELGSGKPIAGGKRIKVSAKLDEIPVYVRAGTILPLGPVMQHTSELPGGPLEVQIYPGHDAAITMTEDDGVTNAYLQGVVRKTNFVWNDADRTLSWKIEGTYAGKDIFKDMTISVFDPDGTKHATASLAGSRQQVVPK